MAWLQTNRDAGTHRVYTRVLFPHLARVPSVRASQRHYEPPLADFTITPYRHRSQWTRARLRRRVLRLWTAWRRRSAGWATCGPCTLDVPTRLQRHLHNSVQPWAAHSSCAPAPPGRSCERLGRPDQGRRRGRGGSEGAPSNCWRTPAQPMIFLSGLDRSCTITACVLSILL